MSIANMRNWIRKANLLGAYRDGMRSPEGAISLPDDWRMRLQPKDEMVRIRYGDDFQLKPKLAGATVLYNLNATYAQGEVERALLANRNWEIQGTNAVNTQAQIARGANGGITLATGANAADQMILAPLSEATVKEDGANDVTYDSPIQATEWNTAKQPVLQVVFNLTASAITTTLLWAGFKLTNTSVIATDNDQAFFRAAAGDLHMVTSVGGQDADVDAGPTLVHSTLYELLVIIDKARYPHYVLNSKWLGKGPRLAALTTLKPFFGVESTAGASVGQATVHYLEPSRDRL